MPTADNLPQIPGYELKRVLGRGGMATVYLATQLSFGRLVALKVLVPQQQTGNDFVKRFAAEAKMVSSLSHPNIIVVYDVGAHDGALYIAMEYHSNGLLSDQMTKGPMDPTTAIHIVRDLARALSYAHEQGIVHRDIKPDNVLFSQHHAPILTDFGIARDATSEQNLTQVGSAVGTPKYMSPEQARGKKVDGRSDIYSIGVMLYEMLAGQPLFDDKDSMALAMKHCQTAAPPLPMAVSRYQPVMDRLLKKDAAQRFQNGNDLAMVLDKITNPANQVGPDEGFVDLPERKNESLTVPHKTEAKNPNHIFRVQEKETGNWLGKTYSRSYNFSAEDIEDFGKNFQKASDDMALWLKKRSKKAIKVSFAIDAHPWIHKRIMDKFIAPPMAGSGFGDFCQYGTLTLHLYSALDPIGKKYLVLDNGQRPSKKPPP